MVNLGTIFSVWKNWELPGLTKRVSRVQLMSRLTQSGTLKGVEMESQSF